MRGVSTRACFFAGTTVGKSHIGEDFAAPGRQEWRPYMVEDVNTDCEGRGLEAEGDGEDAVDGDGAVAHATGFPAGHAVDDADGFAVEAVVDASHDGDVGYGAVGIDYEAAQYAAFDAPLICVGGVAPFAVDELKEGAVASGKLWLKVDYVVFVDFHVVAGYGAAYCRY